MPRFKVVFIALLGCFISFQLHADDLLKQLSVFTQGSQHWFEGYHQNVGENEFSYHSLRNDLTDCLLTRCTTGSMDINWETEVVPEDFSGVTAGFIWIAAIDITDKELFFDVYFNGIKRFEIPSSQRSNWSIEPEDGGVLSFVGVEIDMHLDAHGYMSVVVPADWLQKGSPQSIRVVGRANNDNTWVIVYQASDALSYLQNSLKYDVWMDVEMVREGDKFSVLVEAPHTLIGQALVYKTGRVSASVVLSEQNGLAMARFQLPLSAKTRSFELRDPIGEVFIIESLGQELEKSRLLSKSILVNESWVDDDTIKLKAQRIYKPHTVASLMALSESVLSRGEILLMNSSHQDIAWMDSPEECIVERDTMLITPLLELAGRNTSYRFDLEQALMVKEYVDRHPASRNLFSEMLADGRLSCGASYNQPYEEMYSGEALARQFYFGRKWLKDEFGYDANVYWSVDVPGRTLQMPQILKKAGVDFMVISRFEKGIYNWYSPDGSSVLFFSPGHYGDAYVALQKNFFETAQHIATSASDYERYFNRQSNKPVIPLMSSWDMSPAREYDHHFDAWHGIKELQSESGKYVPARLPPIRYATAPEFFEALVASDPSLGKVIGERPNIWMYIHGPGHQKAVKASREGDILLTMAEKFSAANALADGTFVNYPEDRLRAAWEAKIYPDHGWGGKNGDITDALFWQSYEFAKSEAEKILDRSLRDLAAKVVTDKRNGRPLVVFNSMHIVRTDPVAVLVRFEKSEAFDVELYDAFGGRSEVQLSDAVKYADGSLRSALLNFTAENVPPVGYATWYMKTLDRPLGHPTKTSTGEAENHYYKIVFGNGGLSSIYDKELGQELINAGKFTAGEVFTMRSEGNGAGEFADIQRPDMHNFDSTGNYDTGWWIESSGPVFTSYVYRQPVYGAVVEQRVKLFHQQKLIRFETALLNWEGELYREFRMALPLNMPDAQVAYEVPFGVVKVGMDEMEGAAGERYHAICSEIHPRSIENWISASNDAFGVTMSSSVVVADWIDPTDDPVDYTVIQPVLLASRLSCHEEGNPYLQTGNHYFSFSITSHRPGWINSINFGRQANEGLKAVWADQQFSGAALPETMSFFSTDDPNVLISTVKKAEDSDRLVFRLVDMEGRDKRVTISIFTPVEKAYRASLIEEMQEPLLFNAQHPFINMGRFSIETVMIE